jgi:hypothetical protein
MVILADMLKTKVNLNNLELETRKYKRLPLKVTLFLRSLNNHLSYSRKVETVNEVRSNKC